MRPPSLNGICELPARWSGNPPAPGDFLKSPRGRIAYHILEVRRRNPRTNARRYGYVFLVERRRPEDIPAEATVHAWRWDPRRKRDAYRPNEPSLRTMS